jgi:hypothetical protein
MVQEIPVRKTETVVECIRKLYGDMERQRHIDRIKNQRKHRDASLDERERSLFGPVRNSLPLIHFDAD